MPVSIRDVGTIPYPPGALTVWIPQQPRLQPWEPSRWLLQVHSLHRQQDLHNRHSLHSKYSNLHSRPLRSHLHSRRRGRVLLTTCPFNTTL